MEQLVVDYFAQAIAQVPVGGTPAEIGAARDAAVQEMLAANPAVVNYLRRAVLDPSPPGGACWNGSPNWRAGRSPSSVPPGSPPPPGPNPARSSA